MKNSRSRNSDRDELESAAAELGIVIEGDVDQLDLDDVYHLWPENLQAWNCWIGVQTQWRIGMSGPTGLDYQGVSAYLDRQGLEHDEAREVFGLLQACERVTLEVWSEQRDS